MFFHRTNIQDVAAFCHRFGIATPAVPTPLAEDVATFRINFLKEEVREFEDAVNDKNLTKQADALVDLIYVALGTLLQLGMGTLYQVFWNLVHGANMKKQTARQLGLNGRHPSDVCKPPGWEAPDRDIATLIVRTIDHHREQPSLISPEELAR